MTDFSHSPLAKMSQLRLHWASETLRWGKQLFRVVWKVAFDSHWQCLPVPLWLLRFQTCLILLVSFFRAVPIIHFRVPLDTWPWRLQLLTHSTLRRISNTRTPRSSTFALCYPAYQPLSRPGNRQIPARFRKMPPGGPGANSRGRGGKFKKFTRGGKSAMHPAILSPD